MILEQQQPAANGGRPSLPASMGSAMRLLPRLFRPEKARDAAAVVHISTVGPEPGNWLLTIRDGHCRVDEGSIVNPSLTINAPSDIWLKIMRQELDGASAYRNGEFAFSGDGRVLARLQDWFE